MRHPRRTFDATLAVAVGVVVLGAVIVGARQGQVPAGEAPGAARRGTLDPHGDLLRSSRAARSGIDPLNPPGLPAGVAIDPVSGLLVGIDLRADGQAATPGWTTLAAGNDVARGADLPAAVRALDGRRVVMAGFMMALYSLRNVREFALVGSHTKCCFGIPPGVGDLVEVRVPPARAALALTLAPVRVEGTFRVRPQHLYASGRGPLIRLYVIEDARVVAYGD